MRSIHIGLLGFGVVGQGVLQILRDNGPAIRDRIAAIPVVKKILVRELDKLREVEVERELFTTDPEQVLADADIRVVVELIGGIEPARTWVLRALRAGKHVITANKALLAECGEELFREATARGLDIYFEGSVAGGIPLLRALREGLASDRIEGVVGIVNGTSNYILDAMTRSGAGYAEALADAQRAGFAEADPTMDVEGVDAAHKLALLALVSVGVRIDPTKIPREGIARVRPFDIRTAASLGYVIKSLAIGDFSDPDRPLVRVHPAFVPKDHILAGVHGAYNAVEVCSRALGQSLYYGRGAGRMPTGVAVVSDIIEVCRDIVTFASGLPPGAHKPVHTVEPGPLDEVECENYLCVHVPNVPGVLGRVASCLGRHDVSIKRMNQDTPGPNEPIDMVIMTERVRERAVCEALAEVDTFDCVLMPSHRFRLFDVDWTPTSGRSGAAS